MVDFGSLIFEKFSKINDKTFFHSSNGFVFREDQTLKKKLLLRQKWRPKIKMALNCFFIK
jgi:hypothetical protein